MILRRTEIVRLESGAATHLLMPFTGHAPAKITHGLIEDGIDPDTGERFTEPEAHARVVNVESGWLALLTLEQVGQLGFKTHEQAWRAYQRRWRVSDYNMPETRVFLVHFEVEKLQRPRLVANQHGQIDPQQYVTSSARCIDQEAGEAPAAYFVDRLAAAASAEGEQMRTKHIADTHDQFTQRLKKARAEIEAFDPGNDPQLQRRKRKALRVLEEKEAA